MATVAWDLMNINSRITENIISRYPDVTVSVSVTCVMPQESTEMIARQGRADMFCFAISAK